MTAIHTHLIDKVIYSLNPKMASPTHTHLTNKVSEVEVKPHDGCPGAEVGHTQVPQHHRNAKNLTNLLWQQAMHIANDNLQTLQDLADPSGAYHDTEFGQVACQGATVFGGSALAPAQHSSPLL